MREEEMGDARVSSASAVDAIDAPSQTELAQRVLDALALRAQIAPADKKGKFPMAAMVAGADGSAFDMVPFTVAMTQETFENMRQLYKASRALAEYVMAPLGASTADADEGRAYGQNSNLESGDPR